MRFYLNYGLLKNTFVIARDKKNKKILLGGLGILGVGQMWVDEKLHHKKYRGYKKALNMKFKEGIFV